MSRLFIQNNIWYIDVQYNNVRKRKSLGTKHLYIAKKISRKIEADIIKDIELGESRVKKKNLKPQEIFDQFIKYDHGWKPATYNIYTQRLKYYFNNGFPDNPTSKSKTVRCLNRMYKWGYENHLISEFKPFKGGSKWKSRNRTFTKNEMNLILNQVIPFHFQMFVRFAYYTGARRSEICSLTLDNIEKGYFVGKLGSRMIKLNSQALAIIDNIDELWSYSPFYVSQTFKKNLRRLNIKDGRFHDLRRTFGLNLIKKGMSIYELSKLLGHSSVKTTEKHYAPLLVSEINDFIL